MTYARIASIEIGPDGIESFAQFHRHSLMELGKAVEGFVGVQLLLNPATGQGYTITLWENREAARAAFTFLVDMRGLPEVMALEPMGLRTGFVGGFEVLVDEAV